MSSYYSEEEGEPMTPEEEAYAADLESRASSQGPRQVRFMGPPRGGLSPRSRGGVTGLARGSRRGKRMSVEELGRFRQDLGRFRATTSYENGGLCRDELGSWAPNRWCEPEYEFTQAELDNIEDRRAKRVVQGRINAAKLCHDPMGRFVSPAKATAADDCSGVVSKGSSRNVTGLARGSRRGERMSDEELSAHRAMIGKFRATTSYEEGGLCRDPLGSWAPNRWCEPEYEFTPEEIADIEDRREKRRQQGRINAAKLCHDPMGRFVSPENATDADKCPPGVRPGRRAVPRFSSQPISRAQSLQ